jgi:hypothetical protein
MTGVISMILCIVAMNSTYAQTYTKQPYSETIANGVTTIYAGKHASYSFTIPADASNTYLRGTISSSGGFFREILTTVTDSNGVKHFTQKFPGQGVLICCFLQDKVII